MSASSGEEIGDDDGLQIKPPQHHRRRNREDRQQRRWPGDQDRSKPSGSGRSESSGRGAAESRRREYYEPRPDRGVQRSQRPPEATESNRDRRGPAAGELGRHHKRRYEDYPAANQRRMNPNDASGYRSQSLEVRRSDQGIHRDDTREPGDHRSKQLHKSMKQKRKHIELEEQRALREIEKRNRREQDRGSGEKRRKKRDSSPGHSSPPHSPSPQHSQEEGEAMDQSVAEVSQNSAELDDILVVEEIVKSSPELEDGEDSQDRQDNAYHSDVSSGDDAESQSAKHAKNSKSDNSDSHSSKSGSDSEDSSGSKSSAEDSDGDQDKHAEDENEGNDAGAAREIDKGDVKGSSDVEVLETEKKFEKMSTDESLLTEVDRAIREVNLLPPYFPAVQGCRRVEEFSLLNRIEEGTYGVVYRAKDRRTNEVVALKRLKMEKEKDGFPITSLREINTLLKAQHENIVTVREIVVGSNTDKIFLVMDYVEHDLKALMETLKQKTQKFLVQEVKCLMIQLLRAVAHLHDNWILHRDLKTSNLLLSHKGILKVGDFGLAREYGSPLKAYTPIVVTLWYRAPELLLGIKEYSTPIDVWSVGCIFGELVKMEPTFPGKSEANQLNLIFQTLGTPNDRIWPGYSKLPLLQKMTFVEQPMNKLKTKFGVIGDLGIDLMNKLLTYNPAKRITAEEALNHPFFKESPLPIDPSVFPTWPAKSELGHRKAPSSPKPPSGGRQFKELRDDDDSSSGFFLGTSAADRRLPMGGGFSLKF